MYGCPYTEKKEGSWSLVQKMANIVQIPWLLMGDLNLLLSANNKRGGRTPN